MLENAMPSRSLQRPNRCQMLLLAALVCVFTLRASSAAAEDESKVRESLDRPVAIVVHPETAVSDLTMQELRDIFLAEQQYWPDKSRIVLLVRAPAAYERTFVLNRIYQMSETEFRRYWIAKMFRAEVPSGPRVVFSTNMALGLVTAIPGSITFMLASDVGPDVKVLRIDGKLPHEDGYPLR
jgi:hypothetical protein